MSRLTGSLLSVAAVAWVGCGGVSFQYGGGQARTVQGLQTAMVPGVLDARMAGSPTTAASRMEVDNARELQQVQRGTEEHLRNAGLPPSNTIVAPRNSAEVEGILQAAAQRGLPEVWFVRYQRAGFGQACFSTAILAPLLGILPWIIMDSLPINSHGAVGAFEVIAVDSRSRDVLARSGQVASHQEGVSAWGCGGDGLMREMLGRALQSALEGVEQERVAGYPHRQRLPNVSQWILTAPTVLQIGQMVVGPGWQFEMPQGFQLVPTATGATVSSPAGIALTLVAIPANVSNNDRTFTPPGSQVITREVNQEGYSVALACASQPQVAAQAAPICARALSTLQVQTLHRP